MKKSKSVRRTTKSQTRPEAVKEYVILRLRAEEIIHLDYLLVELKRITLPKDSLYSTEDLANTVRTCFMGWFATLTDRDQRAIYAFDCLFNLFPKRRTKIGVAQQSLEACHEKLQEFRNNVAFHTRSDIRAPIGLERRSSLTLCHQEQARGRATRVVTTPIPPILREYRGEKLRRGIRMAREKPTALF